MDSPGERCGVFAIRAERAAARLTYDGLVALQHRGQESAGIATGDGSRLLLQGGMGLVHQVFDASALASLPGHIAVGHVRYSTAGSSADNNIQPMIGGTRSGHRFALAHNGNLLEVNGLESAFWSDADADTHLLVDAISAQPGNVADALRTVLPTLIGACSMVVATVDEFYAARDAHGFRPLCLGRYGSGGWVIASETTALASVGARFLREVEPGELICIGAGGLHADYFARPRPHPCVFEQVYFARPESSLSGVRVEHARRAMGSALAAEAPVRADVVVPVPETARHAALGYAAASGVPYADGLVRNPHVGRTFIRPPGSDRQLAARLKFTAVPEAVAGRRVALIDDSLVRANTARTVVAMLRDAGAQEVHIRVASPPVRWGCYFGVDIGAGELPAVDRTPAQIADLVGADSLGFLSLAAMVHAAGDGPLCAGCFTGDYPVQVPQRVRCASRSAGGRVRLDPPPRTGSPLGRAAEPGCGS
jgi:amidophosphoribosyltransferase